MLLAHITGLPHHSEEFRVIYLALYFAPVVARLIIHKLHKRKHTMPCDQIRTVTVDIGKVDPGLIDAAIKALNLSANVSYRGNRLVISGDLNEEETAKQVKQAYSAQVVQQQARKMGWQLKEVAPFKYEVLKR